MKASRTKNFPLILSDEGRAKLESKSKETRQDRSTIIRKALRWYFLTEYRQDVDFDPVKPGSRKDSGKGQGDG